VRGGEGWVLLEDQARGGLGGALAWADQQGVAALHLLADAGSGVLARRAAPFRPAPSVWQVEDRSLRPASAEARPVAPDVPPALAALRAVIEEAGAEAVEEHGVLSGEADGLEVCRAVIGDDGTARLDVGIGDHDREAFRLIYGEGPVGPALADVVAQVAAHRRPGAPAHALNRLARERALRHRLIRDPGLIGLTTLAAAPPPVPRTSLSQPIPCVALGAGVDGAPVVVVCSAGVDLDLVPFAADAREALADSGARLILVVPEGDDHPVTRRLAARLAVPAEVVTVPPERPAP
jgi:hypothetical protein